MIEDLNCSKYKMCKIWMNCEIQDGIAKITPEAKAEGIVDVKWYKRDQLDNEIVYPSIIIKKDWNILKSLHNEIY